MSETTEPPRPTPFIIGLVGMDGVGQTSLANGLQDYNAYDIDPQLYDYGLIEVTSIPMRNVIQWHKNAHTDPPHHTGIREIATYHQQIRQAGRGAEIFEPLKGLSDHIYIIDAVHHEEDAWQFKRNGWFLLGLTASVEFCANNLTNDDNDEKHQLAVQDYIDHLISQGVEVDRNDMETIARIGPQARRRAADLLLANAMEAQYDDEQDRRKTPPDLERPGPLRRQSLAARLELADIIIDAEASKQVVAVRAIEAIQSLSQRWRQQQAGDY